VIEKLPAGDGAIVKENCRMPKYYIRVSKKLKKIYLSGCYGSFNADGAFVEF